MMRKTRKTVSVLLAAAMLAGTLGGCAKTEQQEEVKPAQESTAEDAKESVSSVPAYQSEIDWETIGWHADPEGLEWKSNTTPITLDYYVNFAWFGLSWDDDTARRVTEKTGVNLNLTKPVVDDGQKLNMMVAGNQLPDLMTVDKNDPVLQQMIDAGMLWSLDELMEQYAPKMKEILPEEIMSNYQAQDGKTYQFTTWVQGKAWQQGVKAYNQIIGTNQPMIAIRTDYYEEVGRPEIKTMEDFIAVLKQIKEKHPDKIGFYPADGCMSADFFKNNATLGNYGTQVGVSTNFIEKDGKLEWIVRDESFIQAMKYLNEMYQEGLLTKDPFIDTKDVANAKLEQGDAISFSWTISDGGKVPADNPDTSYEILPPLASYHQIRTGAGWLATVIPKTCKDPERAIQFLEYMASVEGHADVSWGIQGDTFEDVSTGATWNIVDGKPTMLPAYNEAKNADWSGVAAQNGLGEYWIACNELLWNLPWWDNSDEKMAKLNEQFGPLVEFRPEYDIVNPTSDSEEGIIRQKAYDLLQQYSVQMVFTDDFESAYNELIQKVDALGMSKVEAYWTEHYNK